MTGAPTSPSLPPTATGWLWSVRILALASALLVAIYLITRFFHRGEVGSLFRASVAAGILTLTPNLAILWLLATSRNKKWGLALAIGWGAVEFGLALWGYSRPLRLAIISHFGGPRIFYQEGVAVWWLRHPMLLRLQRLGPLLQLALAATAIRTYYTIQRAPTDRRILVSGFAAAVMYWGVTRGILAAMLRAALR